MTDVFDPAQRSRVMARVKSKNTRPELAVRSMLHGLGYRFRLHRSDLPGTPDIVLSRYRTVIFVHGCFWHQHPGCSQAHRPATHVAYWNAKLDRNRRRDAEHTAALKAAGWKVILVWECQIKDARRLQQRLVRLLPR